MIYDFSPKPLFMAYGEAKLGHFPYGIRKMLQHWRFRTNPTISKLHLEHTSWWFWSLRHICSIFWGSYYYVNHTILHHFRFATICRHFWMPNEHQNVRMSGAAYHLYNCKAYPTHMSYCTPHHFCPKKLEQMFIQSIDVMIKLL